MSTSWSPFIPPSLNREPLPKDLGEYGRGITLTGLTRGKVPGRTPMETLLEGKKLYTDLEEYQPLPISLPRV